MESLHTRLTKWWMDQYYSHKEIPTENARKMAVGQAKAIIRGDFQEHNQGHVGNLRGHTTEILFFHLIKLLASRSPYRIQLASEKLEPKGIDIGVWDEGNLAMGIRVKISKQKPDKIQFVNGTIKARVPVVNFTTSDLLNSDELLLHLRSGNMVDPRTFQSEQLTNCRSEISQALLLQTGRLLGSKLMQNRLAMQGKTFLEEMHLHTSSLLD